jgi:hypothetical protein
LLKRQKSFEECTLTAMRASSFNANTQQGREIA